MELPPPRPLADRVGPVDALLEPYGVVLRLAAASFLRYHGELLDLYGDLGVGRDDLSTAARQVLADMTCRRDELLAAARAAALDLGGDDGAPLEQLVAVELCESLVLVDLESRL
jgi:hypothetical protein